MTTYRDFPENYRKEETSQIRKWIRSGECGAVLGLSGSGKSNLLSFIANQPGTGSDSSRTVLIDCNLISAPNLESFFRVIYRGITLRNDAQVTNIEDLLEIIGPAIQDGLNKNKVLCLIFDRFDALFSWPEFPILSNNMRSLRDRFKYRLIYIIGSRTSMSDQSELAELFFGHTIWLGPLTNEDAVWSARRDLSRMTGKEPKEWNEAEIRSLISISGGYPAFLRAVCEATASGAPADIQTLIQHPAVTRRLDEFWADKPTRADLERSGLINIPLITISKPDTMDLPRIDERILTAKEDLLLKYLVDHADAVCEKDDLIRAVWPEDVIFDRGIRDESLAQLVRRLRVKIEPDPTNPKLIRTIPGRGYLFHQSA